MEYVILWRNTRDGAVRLIHDDEVPDRARVFKSKSEARAFARDSTLLNYYPYQTVELDGL